VSKKCIEQFPPELVPDEMAKQAFDVEFHWVTEHGQDGKLTAGASIRPTVSCHIDGCSTPTNICSMTSKLALR
jgi:hypothetical protein